MKGILEKVFAGIFCCAIIIFLIGMLLCYRNTDEFMKWQSEYKAPDTIKQVHYNQSEELIYVCYEKAAYVNVYSKDGEFKWALATPYMRNPKYTVQDDMFIIYDDVAYMYLYDTGQHIINRNKEDMTLDEEYSPKYANENGIYFDSYNVYVEDENGEKQTKVTSPWWHRIFCSEIDWLIAIMAAIGLGVVRLSDKRKEYKEIKERRSKKNKSKGIDKKARFVINYYKAMMVVHVVFGIVVVIASLFSVPLMLGAVPLVVHFIIACDLLNKKYKKFQIKADEYKMCNYWSIMSFISICIMLLLLVVAVFVYG